ncbi:hypothetical protein [uncultured Sphingomonas sp.]|uniref:hypothetical protein n=1 Tax=uncultured Sphingomonas sp. TaxID=158754 RepID=UPI0035CCA4BB
MRVLPLALLLAACSATPDDPGQVTPDEDRRLNEAAEVLDANSVDDNGTGANGD